MVFMLFEKLESKKEHLSLENLDLIRLY